MDETIQGQIQKEIDAVLKAYGNPKRVVRLQMNEEAKNPNNAYCRSNNTGKGFKGMFMKADYKQYKERWVAHAKEVMVGRTKCDSDILVISQWTFGTLRKKDVQNCGKLEYDALNDIVYKDDSQIMREVKFKVYDKKNPTIILDIYDLGDSKQWG